MMIQIKMDTISEKQIKRTIKYLFFEQSLAHLFELLVVLLLALLLAHAVLVQLVLEVIQIAMLLHVGIVISL